MKKRTYKYVIELTTPFWPRKLADGLENSSDFHGLVVSAKDLQNDTHIYGDTYKVIWDGRCVRCHKAFDISNGGNVCNDCLAVLKQ